MGIEWPLTVHVRAAWTPASFLCVTLLTPNSQCAQTGVATSSSRTDGEAEQQQHPVQQRQVGQTEGNGE